MLSLNQPILDSEIAIEVKNVQHREEGPVVVQVDAEVQGSTRYHTYIIPYLRSL